MKELNLKPKHERFCREYIIDLNATQAAIRAGYSEKTARSQGQRLLTNVDIQNFLRTLKSEIVERNNITIDKYVNILDQLATFDIADIYDEHGNLKPVHEIPEDARMAIESLESDEFREKGILISVTKKVKMTNRRSAIDILLKHLGGYEKDNDQKKDIIVSFKD